ncbi:MAG TPA: zinc-dependent alcohol dehydrogenase family protein [Chloroflexota bacterium]|nr:zinc-dependent alcohol dehydrogenase family protein [Chloroflexota bacterium]
MQAVLLDSPHRASVQQVPDPEVRAGDVVVRVERCGLCGTDQHLFDGDYALTRYPVIPGHELSGIVEEVGAGVSSIRPGQLVVIEPNIHCERCHFCHVQRGNHCLNLEVIGVNRAGGFAQYVAAPERNVYPVDGLTAEQAAFVEPLSCVVHGLRRLRLAPAARVLIVGAGPIGLLMLQAVRRSGAAQAVVTDLRASRLQLARLLGAEQTVEADADAPQRLRDLAPYGFDAAIDVTGVPSVVQSLLPSVTDGGSLLIFGVSPEQATISVRPYELFRRDLTILGSFAVAYTFEDAITMLQSGAVQVDRLVSHRLPLSGYEAGLAAARAGEGSMKVQLLPDTSAISSQ